MGEIVARPRERGGARVAHRERGRAGDVGHETERVEERVAAGRRQLAVAVAEPFARGVHLAHDPLLEVVGARLVEERDPLDRPVHVARAVFT